MPRDVTGGSVKDEAVEVLTKDWLSQSIADKG
jgi:hypothetical protein